MPKCKLCNKEQIISGYCKDHFIQYFEKTVEKTIKKFNLLKKTDKILIGVSGGKDSLATAYILKKLGYNVAGLAIDEGIKGYREHTLIDLKKFSKKYNFKITIKSFEKEFGVTLDKAVKKLNQNPCHICGVLRRFLLNKYAKDYDILATGHNLDDEAQAIMMNILKSQVELQARLGPISGIKLQHGFTKRVKPLYFLKEKEVKAYTILKGFDIRFSECNYTTSSFRSSAQDELNKYETIHNGSKLNLIKHFLKELPRLKEKFKTIDEVKICVTCGEPSANEQCRTCQLIDMLKITN